MAELVGSVLHSTHGYAPIFVVAGSIYLVALLIIELLMPEMTTTARL